MAAPVASSEGVRPLSAQAASPTRPLKLAVRCIWERCLDQAHRRSPDWGRIPRRRRRLFLAGRRKKKKKTFVFCSTDACCDSCGPPVCYRLSPFVVGCRHREMGRVENAVVARWWWCRCLSVGFPSPSFPGCFFPLAVFILCWSLGSDLS